MVHEVFVRICICDHLISDHFIYTYHLISGLLLAKGMSSRSAGEMHVSGRNRNIVDLDLSQVFATEEEQQALALVRSLDLAENKLAIVRSLQPLASLTSLDLSVNCISSLSGLPLGLVRLNLCRNKLVSIHGIAALPCLQELDISHNRIISLKGFPRSSSLTVLHASHNRIAKSFGLECLSRLQLLNLGNNFLSTADDLDFLRALPKLAAVRFSGCPVSELEDYRELVGALQPSISLIDGSHVGKETLEPTFDDFSTHSERLLVVESPRKNNLGVQSAQRGTEAKEFQRFKESKNQEQFQQQLEVQKQENLFLCRENNELKMQLVEARRIIAEEVKQSAALGDAKRKLEDEVCVLQRKLKRLTAELRNVRSCLHNVQMQNSCKLEETQIDKECALSQLSAHLKTTRPITREVQGANSKLADQLKQWVLSEMQEHGSNSIEN